MTPYERKVIAQHPTFTIRDNSGHAYLGGQAHLAYIEDEAIKLTQLTGYTMNVYIVGKDAETYLTSYSLVK